LNYVEVIGDAAMKERDAKLRSNGVANPKPRDDGRELGKQWRAGQLPQNPNPNPRLSNPPKHLEGECVAAGWPSWLSSVAGEAVRGWIPRRADSFEKLDKVKLSFHLLIRDFVSRVKDWDRMQLEFSLPNCCILRHDSDVAKCPHCLIVATSRFPIKERMKWDEENLSYILSRVLCLRKYGV
jgi:hypothetical protein